MVRWAWLVLVAACSADVASVASHSDAAGETPRPTPGAPVTTTASASTPSPSPPPPHTQPTALPVTDGFYPRVIQRAAGGIVASVVRALPSGHGGATIFASDDEGLSFHEIGAVNDPRTSVGVCCGTLFELPRAVGAMPAGTLLYSASIGGDTPAQPMALPIWKSADGGRTWTFLANIAVASKPRRNGGLWEPEFAVLDDGTLTAHWSDETDSAHSQKLVVARSSDGITWRDQHDTIALAAFGDRPGMANVRKSGNGWLMSYEVCGSNGCAAFTRTSTDGWSWGDRTNIGFPIATIDGLHFRHAPTLAWSAAPGESGRFLVIGQMTYDANGAVARENGTLVFSSPEGGTHAWYTIPAAVPIPEAKDNFCPNYSSSLLPLENGTVALELASRWDGSLCKTYFARSPLIDTTDGSEIQDGGSYQLKSLMSGLCLTAGSAITQQTCNGNQRWTISRRADGTVTLVSGPTILFNHDWKVRGVGAGYYELSHAGTTQCLDVSGGSTHAGDPVAEWQCNDLAPQIWKLDM
jgi:hypothetical protein